MGFVHDPEIMDTLRQSEVHEGTTTLLERAEPRAKTNPRDPPGDYDYEPLATTSRFMYYTCAYPNITFTLTGDTRSTKRVLGNWGMLSSASIF